MNTQIKNIALSERRVVKIIKGIILRNPSAIALSLRSLVEELKAKVAQQYQDQAFNLRNPQFLKILRKAIKQVNLQLSLENQSEFSDKDNMTAELVEDFPNIENSREGSIASSQLEEPINTSIIQSNDLVDQSGNSHNSDLRGETSMLPQHQNQAPVTVEILQIEQANDARDTPQSTIEERIQSPLEVEAQNQNDMRNSNPWLIHLQFAQQNNLNSQEGFFRQKVKRLINKQFKDYRWELDRARQQAPKSQLEMTQFIKTTDQRSTFQSNNIGRVVYNKQTSFGLIRMGNLEVDYFINNRKDLQLAGYRYAIPISSSELSFIKSLGDKQFLNKLTGKSFKLRKKLYYMELKNNKLI